MLEAQALTKKNDFTEQNISSSHGFVSVCFSSYEVHIVIHQLIFMQKIMKK